MSVAFTEMWSNCLPIESANESFMVLPIDSFCLQLAGGTFDV